MKKTHGFTLIELLVSIAIFSIVVTIGVGGFVHALRTQREVASLINTQSNASLALEQMAREIRYGFLFCRDAGKNSPNAACQPSGANGCTVSGGIWTCNNILDFYNSDTQDVDYTLANGQLVRKVDGTGSAISGDNVDVQYLTFTLFGNAEDDHWPPRITIAMGIVPSSTDSAIASDTINLQTTVSAREIDCTQTSPPQC
jgi:prepilin-type N-terminal cleavage/methylation domain-containing protein